MKIFHNVYDELISLDNIFDCWRFFRSGKSGRKEVMEFEHNLEDNLFALREDLKELKYKHSNYHEFVICDPKKRIIHKARIRDRIVHTIVANKLEEIYQPVFISHSYACQEGKGIHKAQKDLMRFAKKASCNYRNNFWYLKCDIKKFFDNIDHEILVNILKNKIKDEKFLCLIKEIIYSFSKDQKGKGLPLGNFTSQWLANIYLNELDYFVKHRLNIKYYLRYADDFLALNKNRDALVEYSALIKRFLNKRLKLQLHKDKVMIKKFSAGIDFVGYKVLPYYIRLRKQTKNRMLEKLDRRQTEFSQNKIGIWEYSQTLNSYLGLLKHANEHKLTNKIIHKQYG